MAHNHRMQPISDPHLNVKKGLGIKVDHFSEGREAVRKGMLPLPSTSDTSKIYDYFEGYEMEEHLQGIPSSNLTGI
jgi:hypothetical protein